MKRILTVILALSLFTSLYSQENFEEGIMKAFPKEKQEEMKQYPCILNHHISVAFKDYQNEYYSMTSRTQKVEIDYEKPPVISYISESLQEYLKKHPNPRVIVRVLGAGSEIAEQERTRPYYNYIEEQLARIGCKVLDRNLISQVESKNGYIDYQSIKNRIQADLIIEVSWLRFSDPDMWVSLNKFEIDKSDSVKYAVSYWEKRSRNPKQKFKKNPYLAKAGVNKEFRQTEELYSTITDINEVEGLSAIQTNKNVVSTLCKIILVSEGTLEGTIHVGIDCRNKNYFSYVTHSVHSSYGEINNPHYPNCVYSDDIGNMSGGPWTPFRKLSEIKKWEFKYSIKSWDLNILAINTHPYAAQLNAGEDAKISEARTITQNNSNSSGNGSTHYGYYSSYSRGNSASNSSTTTTQVDAKYIRCSNFYDCYRPLAEQLANELKKYIKNR